MSPETDELLQKAMTLPLEARAEVACSLIDSLDETVDEDAEVAWQQEVVRRMDEIRSGKVKTIPGSQLLERLKARQRDAQQ
jgi:putative addiction module component (TIGR02574 family)